VEQSAPLIPRGRRSEVDITGDGQLARDPRDRFPAAAESGLAFIADRCGRNERGRACLVAIWPHRVILLRLKAREGAG
jgi:hypothetical protein